jgi:hypothetical protein
LEIFDFIFIFCVLEQGHRRDLKLLEQEYNEKIARLEAQVK